MFLDSAADKGGMFKGVLQPSKINALGVDIGGFETVVGQDLSPREMLLKDSSGHIALGTTPRKLRRGRREVASALLRRSRSAILNARHGVARRGAASLVAARTVLTRPGRTGGGGCATRLQD